MKTSPISPYSNEKIVEQLLHKYNIVLTPQQRAWYVPQLSALAEQKLGSELMEKLDDQKLREFEKLFKNPKTTGKKWDEFWSGAIPNFSEFVEQSVERFGHRLEDLLRRIGAHV